MVMVTLVALYCVLCKLLKIHVCAISEALRSQSLSIETAMKEIQSSQSFLDYLNDKMSFAVGLVVLVNVIRFVSGSIWFFSELEMWVSFAPTLVFPILALMSWLVLIGVPLHYAGSVSEVYTNLPLLGRCVRVRPFGFQSVPISTLDSFVGFANSVKESSSAKVFQIPVRVEWFRAAMVVVGTGAVIFAQVLG